MPADDYYVECPDQLTVSVVHHCPYVAIPYIEGFRAPVRSQLA
jgi:hypothetical protein